MASSGKRLRAPDSLAERKNDGGGKESSDKKLFSLYIAPEAVLRTGFDAAFLYLIVATENGARGIGEWPSTLKAMGLSDLVNITN